jgi:hypothetical protein
MKTTPLLSTPENGDANLLLSGAKGAGHEREKKGKCLLDRGKIALA